MTRNRLPERPIGSQLGTARYAVAVCATMVAFAATFALKRVLPTPSFLLFIPAMALTAWYGGIGPSVLTTMLSLILIKLVILPPVGTFRIADVLDVLDALAFVLVAITITATMEALRRARHLAEARTAELERVNRELRQIGLRGSKLLDVTTALSQAPSIDDVADVALCKGLAVVEASRGLLACFEGGRIAVLGAYDFDPEINARVRAEGHDVEALVMEAIRTGEEVWIDGADEYRARFPNDLVELVFDGELHAWCAIPLIHAGETLGALGLRFAHPRAFGITDRAFTLLLAQATATAMHRARSYDAERQMRRDAELLARAREEVLGVVAHDLRNPIGLIGMTTQLLLEEELTEPRRKEMLGVAARATKQMNRLVGDLLDTVRLQAGRLSLDLEEVRVMEFLRQTDETFHPVADERKVRLEVIVPELPSAVRADPLRLSQIVGNLMGNALKFTPAHGQVTLRTAARDGVVVFRVDDTGPGIPPDHVEHLFDRFWQADRTDRRGVGLGLAIARALVEAHGGRIWVESAVGAGSTFSFTVPATAASTHIA